MVFSIAAIFAVVFRRNAHAALAGFVDAAAGRIVIAISETPGIATARLAGIARVAVQARLHAPPAHANLLSARAVDQFVFAIGRRVASIRGTRIAVLAFGVFETSILTCAVSAGMAAVAPQRVPALRKTGSLNTDFRGSAHWRVRLAPCRGCARIIRAGVIVIAKVGVAVTTVD